jgi:hypothetical protein
MAENKDKRTVEIIVNGQQANASLKEMNAAAAVLYSQFSKMSADDPGRAKLVADYRALKDRIADVKTELTGVSQNAGVMKQAFANAFALFTGGGILDMVQKVWGFFMDSRQEALASAKTSADLENTLRSTAHAAGLTAQEIRNIGEARAKVTLFDDETNAASALLLTFTNIKKGVFEDAIPAIQDLATKMGGEGPADMKGATVQLGKALNDPIKGISALTKVGVSFTEAQKEQIAQMVKAGDTAGAQRLILNELNKEFGGTAESARKAAGGVATLSLWFGEFKETVGGKVNQVLDALSQWLGRVLEKSQPLVEMVSALVDEFAAYYREIGDVLEGLGLFTDKTDTAGLVIEVLKGALTLLLIPLRTLLQVSKGAVDLFVDWYNKSELLRGVLGGLGAMIVSVFTTIKDDAIKILGGVGDILVGIFTLDKGKMVAGFKAALAGTADLALESGQKAAEAFARGYEANKNNHITRTVSVKTEETGGAEVLPTGAGKEAPAGESAADLKKRLEALLKQHQAEIEAERHHQEMLLNLREVALLAQGNQRAIEWGKIELDAQRKVVALAAAEQKEELLVTGTQWQKNAKIAALQQEKDAAVELLMAEDILAALLHQLQAKYAEQDAAQVKQDVADQLADIEAAEVEKEALLQEQFEQALLSEQQYAVQIYDAKHAALEAELALLRMFGGLESAEYRKKYKELEKLEKDKNKEDLAEAKRMQKAKWDIAQLTVKTAGDVVQTTIDLLFQDEAARRKHHNMYTALSGAKIIMDGVQEVANIWRYSAENPANGLTGGIAGAVIGGVQTALAVARTAVGLVKLREFSFAQGGRTGGGLNVGAGSGTGGREQGSPAVSPLGTLMEMAGMAVAPNGRLVDHSGFAVAGIVHEDEYVVPKWMRADPQVAAVEQWLEARRLRGYFEGGATGSMSALPPGGVLPASEGERSYAVQTEMLSALQLMTQQLADVKDWQARLSVQLHAGELEDSLAERKQVKLENGIRA